MKTLLTTALILGTALSVRAEDQTIDLSRGRGQTVPYKAPLPAGVVSKGVRKEPAVKAAPAPGVMRPVTIYTARGPVIVMKEFPR